MLNKILGVLLAMVVIAPTPVPTQVFSVIADTTRTSEPYSTFPISVSTSVPTGSQLFSDEEEVLASIYTGNHRWALRSLGMNTTLTRLS